MAWLSCRGRRSRHPDSCLVQAADCRHAVVELPGGIELHNIYVPAGGDIPDPEANPKFAHKLQFLDEITEWFGAERQRRLVPMIAVGDLNIAPLETDVWSHKQLLRVVSHTPVEVERLGAIAEGGRFRRRGAAFRAARRSGCTLGGAIAPATGLLRIAGAASIISG